MVPSGSGMVQLPLQVLQQGACSQTEQVGVGPLLSQLFHHESEPETGVLGSSDPTSRLEAHLVASQFVVFSVGGLWLRLGFGFEFWMEVGGKFKFSFLIKDGKE